MSAYYSRANPTMNEAFADRSKRLGLPGVVSVLFSLNTGGGGGGTTGVSTDDGSPLGSVLKTPVLPD